MRSANYLAMADAIITFVMPLISASIFAYFAYKLAGANGLGAAIWLTIVIRYWSRP